MELLVHPDRVRQLDGWQRRKVKFDVFGQVDDKIVFYVLGGASVLRFAGGVAVRRLSNDLKMRCT